MESAQLVRIGALDPFVDILRSAGAPARPYLEVASIPEELLARPDSLITKRQLGLTTLLIEFYFSMSIL